MPKKKSPPKKQLPDPLFPEERTALIEKMAESLQETYKGRATKEDATIAQLIHLCQLIRLTVTEYERLLERALEDPDISLEDIEPVGKRLYASYDGLHVEHHKTKWSDIIIGKAFRYALDDFTEIQERAEAGGHITLESLCEADREARELVKRYSENPLFLINKILERNPSELAINYIADTWELDERSLRRKLKKLKVFLV
jgi:hypothetical protein